MTNEKVRSRIKNAIRVHDDLLTMVKKRKLRFYGHVSRSSGMARTVLQGTVKEARRRGRQKKRLEDNIKEWTRMEFGDSLRAAEDRVSYCYIVICGVPTTVNVKRLRRDKITQIRCGLVVRIPGFHPGGPGSIPGIGKYITFFLIF